MGITGLLILARFHNWAVGEGYWKSSRKSGAFDSFGCKYPLHHVLALFSSSRTRPIIVRRDESISSLMAQLVMHWRSCEIFTFIWVWGKAMILERFFGKSQQVNFINIPTILSFDRKEFVWRGDSKGGWSGYDKLDHGKRNDHTYRIPTRGRRGNSCPF